jgi:hypothetical protein
MSAVAARGRNDRPEAQTFPSLWTVCARQLGQNFRSESFSLFFFLFFVLV